MPLSLQSIIRDPANLKIAALENPRYNVFSKLPAKKLQAPREALATAPF